MSKSPHFLTNEQLLFALSQVKTATAIHVGEDATIQTANDAMLKIWGKDSSVIGKSLEDALPELKGQPFVELFRKVWLEGLTISGSDTPADLLINGHLETFYFDFEYKAIKDSRGKTLCVLHTAIDVTERVLSREALEEAKITEDLLSREQALNEELAVANEELRQTEESLNHLNHELDQRVTDRVMALYESEERFRTMAEGTDIFIAVGDESSNAIYFNQAWTDLTGRPMENLLKFGWVDLIHPDDKDGYVELYLSAFKKQIPFTGEFRVLSKQGDYHWLLAKGPPRFRPDGSFAGYICSCIDITERKLWEKSLEDYASELQQMNGEIASSNEELRIANEELAYHRENLLTKMNELEASEHHKRNIVENAPFPIGVYIGREMRIELANQAIINVWGKGNDVIGKLYSDILPELENQDIYSQLDSVFTTGIAFHARNQRIDLFVEGKLQPYYFNYSFTALRDQDGVVYGVMNTAAEVTDVVLAKKQVEEASEKLAYINEELAAANEEMEASNEELARTNAALTDIRDQLQFTFDELAISEKRFKFLIQEAPVAIGMLNGRELVIESANELILKIWGKSKKIIGKTLAAALPELQGQPFLQLLDDVYTTGKTFKGYDTAAVIEHQGELIESFFDFIYQPLLNSEGRTTDIIVVAIDVTEKVVNRREIERAEESLRMAVEAAELGSYYINVIDRILYPSVRLKEFFGFAPDEEVPYEAAINQIHPDYRQAAADLVEASMTRGVRFDMEYPIIQHNGGPMRWVRGIGTVQKDHKGVNRYFTGVLHDITERKLDELRKNDFIGMVSHELKTPLTSLTAIIQVLNAKLKKSEDTFISGALDKANVQVKKMTSMINGFLNISRLESGKITIDKQKFDLAALVADTIKEAELTVYTHSIRFENAGPAFIDADYNKIGSVISNLISNAVKYSPGEKLIEVKCELVRNNAQVSVKDEGIGINPQDAEKLFERFYRVENAVTEHISGFGIGLYLSAEIIERHHGKIWVESTPGEGSTFFFSLPL